MNNGGTWNKASARQVKRTTALLYAVCPKGGDENACRVPEQGGQVGKQGYGTYTKTNRKGGGCGDIWK